MNVGIMTSEPTSQDVESSEGNDVGSIDIQEVKIQEANKNIIAHAWPLDIQSPVRKSHIDFWWLH